MEKSIRLLLLPLLCCLWNRVRKERRRGKKKGKCGKRVLTKHRMEITNGGGVCVCMGGSLTERDAENRLYQEVTVLCKMFRKQVFVSAERSCGLLVSLSWHNITYSISPIIHLEGDAWVEAQDELWAKCSSVCVQVSASLFKTKQCVLKGWCSIRIWILKKIPSSSK